MITRDINTEINAATVNSCLQEWNGGATRREMLMDYFLCKHQIMNRLRTPGLPNNRLVHAFPQYIATMTSSYLIGDPVQYMSDEQEAALAVVKDAYDGADVESIDAEIAQQQAIFGVGVELLYINRDAEPRTTCIDRRQSFVVYDDTAEGYPMFGIYRLIGQDGSRTFVKSIVVYTDSDIITFQASDEGIAGKIIDVEPHNFGDVPMVEYWNNSEETGDFEQVISLIDAYDTLESDRINDKTQFTDALLVLTGVVGFQSADGDLRTPAQRLKEEGTLSLPDKDASAYYLVKTLNEADTDILKESIKKDIHRFSYVPDMSDENFAGNASGVAMRYKLLGLEQLTRIKERWFKEGLKWRLTMFAHFLAIKGASKLDADRVRIVFRRSLPVNDMEIAQMVQMLQGIVPDNELLAQVPFVDDVASSIEQMDEQRAKGMKAQAQAFGNYLEPIEE